MTYVTQQTIKNLNICRLEWTSKDKVVQSYLEEIAGDTEIQYSDSLTFRNFPIFTLTNGVVHIQSPFGSGCRLILSITESVSNCGLVFLDGTHSLFSLKDAKVGNFLIERLLERTGHGLVHCSAFRPATIDHLTKLDWTPVYTGPSIRESHQYPLVYFYKSFLPNKKFKVWKAAKDKS